jgi:hypothetical protein
MDRPPVSRRRVHRLLVAAALGVAVLGAMPWSVAADEPSAPAGESPADPTADPSTDPSPDPTAPPEPTPAPTPPPAPTAAPTPAPTSAPTQTPNTALDHTPEPTTSQTPSPTTSRTPSPTPRITTTSLNLYRYSAMVRQYTNYWCVPATVQSMANLVLGTSNRTYARQSYIYRLTRMHNRYRYATRGNDPQGWAWSLRYFTHHRPYYARAYSDKNQAIASIASSLARTRQPVGVTVYSGTHAWVVLGYRQSFDRTEPSKKTLLGFYVSGPLGTARDRWPYRYLTVSQFKEVFTRYHEWQRRVIWEGKWVVVGQ